jgi:hypothetical protein
MEPDSHEYDPLQYSYVYQKNIISQSKAGDKGDARDLMNDEIGEIVFGVPQFYSQMKRAVWIEMPAIAASSQVKLFLKETILFRH